MRIDIISLFPEFIEAFYEHSIIGRARAAGLLDLDVTNPRHFTFDRHHMVDDTLYGGGCGMLMKAAPLYAAVEVVRRQVPKRHIIFMGPAGRRFDQQTAREFAAYDQLIILCGHYEGIDYRAEKGLVDETVSLGDFILTGGEIPAMAVVDAVARMIPGVLGAAGSAAADSFAASLLEQPQYTKPAVFREMAVPDVVRSGDHARIEKWRREQMLERTLRERPDLLAQACLSDSDRQYLEFLQQGEGKKR
ncbi:MULTISPECIES: tRNA (guanosine(37)-N1)-methyltransferase TrmD [Megasphaera]|uniref:tRNA (guanine-N(1)-)-methyltransferase n=1 Tax=Megasphaera vaginalis (ex Srinivasan et al. 2021) TaxID=1111454 RepID=U7UTC2_9FIRM|nr:MULTISPECIES: tRNA (guanosine(37)-N1)-methyltransferase TrmD [Megasphaera]ERT61693.1 tRNA (guanine(37)-N(1))-methyltransferase [Megasphaera vaginalis (ex Srinivasan et al. 2021)]